MYKTLITILLTLSLSWGQEVRKIKIGTFLIPQLVESKTEGEFVKLISLLSKRSGIPVEIIIMPPKRAYKELELGTIDGLFPAMHSRGLLSYKTITEFYTKEMFAFEKVGSDFKKIKNARVCVVSGFTYPESLIEEKGWKKVPSSTDETCLQLLNKNRVDFFLGELRSARSALKSLQLTNKVQYNEYMPLSRDKATLAFKNNQEGHKLSEKFDKALKEVIIDGNFEKIFSNRNK